MAITYCRNTTLNGNWCKTRDEIDSWLSRHVNFFVHQETNFLPDIWADNPIVEEHPYFGDRANYFPTVK